MNLDAQGLPTGYVFDEAWEVTPRQVKAALEEGEALVLIDCRTPEEHRVARIEGAELVPMQDIPSRLQELAAHAEQRVVVHCHHGSRSMQVAAFLRQHDFEDVRSMAGGIDLWSVDIDPAVPRY